MSNGGDFPIHLVPDDGRRYHRGQRVKVDRSGPRLDIIPDPNGEYEVHDWRRETKFSGHVLLRVELRKVGL